MNRWKKVAFGAIAAVALTVGIALPAQAADSVGTSCGGTVTTCVLTIKTHTTSGSVTINWHNTNATSTVKVTLFGPYNYTCTLEGTGTTKSKVCPSVPGGQMKVTVYKPLNKYAYFGAAW